MFDGLMEPALLTIEDFFRVATDDYCLASNLQPHPTAAEFRAALLELSQKQGVEQVLLDVVEFDGNVPLSDGVVLLTTLPAEAFQGFADRFRADGVITPDRHTLRRLGERPKNLHAWKIVWD